MKKNGRQSQALHLRGCNLSQWLPFPCLEMANSTDRAVKVHNSMNIASSLSYSAKIHSLFSSRSIIVTNQLMALWPLDHF